MIKLINTASTKFPYRDLSILIKSGTNSTRILYQKTASVAAHAIKGNDAN